MSKLDDLKLKVTAVRSQLVEKTDKIPLLKSWKASREEASKRGPNPLALSQIYGKGNLATRLQVLLIFVFAGASLYFTYQAGHRIFKGLRASRANEELKKEVSHGLEEIQHHKVEEAKVVSLGQFSTNTFGGPSGEAMVNMDMWLRVSDPDAAAFVDQNSARLNDLAMGVLNDTYHRRVNFLDEEGKEIVKREVQAALNKAIPKGKVEEVFFHNLVVQ
ncbi:MAG: flagellar basal body-associated FliL family protein [Proteobacteria bacterium]|nr:MAG: flagellar basal body-associated FliL family protein [Pseudomonadota bacterium]